MLKGLRVPQHRVDRPGHFIFSWDDAWDRDLVIAERAELVAMALTDKQADACAKLRDELGRDLTDEEAASARASCVLTAEEEDAASNRHPVPLYIAGDTRFDPQAVDQSPSGPKTAFAYLREGVDPTIFTLRRVGHVAKMRIESLALSSNAKSYSAWVKAGVERISCGTETLWQATTHARELTDEWLDYLAESDQGALMTVMVLAEACKAYNRPLSASELKA